MVVDRDEAIEVLRLHGIFELLDIHSDHIDDFLFTLVISQRHRVGFDPLHVKRVIVFQMVHVGNGMPLEVKFHILHDALDIEDPGAHFLEFVFANLVSNQS